ncbi:MAG: ribonuclease J [candidate division FCPU426 bacterium]
MKRPLLRILPLGGLGEIGKNFTLIEYENDVLIVDCGIRFPNPVEYPGIDLILPDFSYLRTIKDRVRAVVLTHGHEDHIGGLAYLLRDLELPIYGTRFTLELARHRIEEQGMLSRCSFNEIGPDRTVEIGVFRLGFFWVCHSIAEGLGLAIETPLGLVVHTGDFKFDSDPVDGRKIDLHALRQIGDLGVLLLISDSTNVDRPGNTPSERSVGPALEAAFAGAKRRIITTSFASHVHRFQQVLEAAEKAGRKLATLGRSMTENMRLAAELGLLKVPKGLWLDFDDLRNMDPARTVVVSTGSQGEPNSGLVRMATGQHPDLRVEPGDLLVYSARSIPGNERSIGHLINNFYRQGAEVITERQAQVHASGHGAREDLRQMLRLLRPRYFIPGHGELRHQVAHKNLAWEEGIEARRIFVLENGQPWEFDGTDARVGQKVPAGEVLVDGVGIGDEMEPMLRDRRHLNEAGMVVCMLGLSRETGEILSGPDIMAHGVLSGAEAGIIEEAKEAVRAALAGRRGADWDGAREIITSTLKRFFKRRLGRRPVIMPAVMEL